MTPGMGLPPILVEQALRLLPDVDALMPLRAFLVSTSRTLSTTEPYRTVGKRQVQPPDLRNLMPHAVAQVTRHLGALYEAALDALEAEQRSDLPAAVDALLRAGEREQDVGRYTPARAWYDHALRLGEELRHRRPEMEALRRLGTLETVRGRFDEAARLHQRGFALAEAEFDGPSAALACLGLGDVTREQAKWLGAESWYTRGLGYAEGDPLLTARIHLGLGQVAGERGQYDIAADRLRRAHTLFEQVDHAEGVVQSLNATGRLETARERYDEAQAVFREALARVRGGRWRDPRLEMSIRINLCRLYQAWTRYPDAEDEVRRAEETAIVHNLTRDLARLYHIMGQVRGQQGDFTAFVFFEKALELSRGAEPAPRLEAEVYVAYGRFRRSSGDLEEARGYFERAREILEDLGNGPMLAAVDAELATLQTA